MKRLSIKSKLSITRISIFAVLSITLFLLNPAELSAQYKVNKHLYNHHDYNSEMEGKYSVAGAGIASLLVPGLGQILSGEAQRGVIFLATEIGTAVLFPIGLVTAFASRSLENLGIFMMLTSMAGVVIIPIVAMTDAIKVARVNNLVWLDATKTGTSFRLSPDLKILPNTKLAPALTLSVTF